MCVCVRAPFDRPKRLFIIRFERFHADNFTQIRLFDALLTTNTCRSHRVFDMERRRTGGVLQSPPQQYRGRRACDRDEFNNNNVTTTGGNNNCSTTLLVDELEQLRTDNFQLRLRVYNAERRVDRLSAACRRRSSTGNDEDASCTDSGGGTTSDDDDDAAATTTTTNARATAEAAVRTIHDLLTVNRRLLALLATAVSAKAVAVTADDKRRWRLLRDHMDDIGTGEAADGPPRVITQNAFCFVSLFNSVRDVCENRTNERNEMTATTNHRR